MKDKKHIDRLFQESLKDFEATPNQEVWERIQESLQHKKQRRIVPIWWRVAGAAALIALLFSAGTLWYFKTDTTTTPVVEIAPPSKPTNKDNGLTTPKNNSSVAQETPQNLDIDTDNFVPGKNTSSSQGAPTVVTANQNVLLNKKASRNTGLNQAQTAVITPQKNTVTNGLEATDNKATNLTQVNQSSNPKIADHDALNNTKEDSSFNELKDTQTAAIEEALAQVNPKNEKEKEGLKSNRWHISPSVAPVYFNSMGKGSSLDGQFIENAKVGDVSMSFGINTSYAINNKIKVRVGVHKVDLGYRTEDIISYSSLNASVVAMKNVKLDYDTKANRVISSKGLAALNVPEIIAAKSQGAIDQELGFIEVPVELEYALLDTKLGIHVIGGFSTFFAQKNDIYTVNSNGRSHMGKATNINNTSYSANVGLGVNYSLTEKVKLNLEPMFKYQMNTFSNTSGNFKPYFIGVYSGLSFKF